MCILIRNYDTNGSPKGKDSYVAKAVYQLDIINNNIIKEFDTIVQAAKTMNVTSQSISRAIKNNGCSCGYNWIYKNGNSKESSIDRV
jgi:hypothetical protein